jgi:hypothetical protein
MNGQGGNGGGNPMDRKNQEGGMGGRGGPKTLPNEDPFTKQVWGHLPEKLRQQAIQSYREQFMPRYSDLLKQYYSTLSELEKTTNPKKSP